MFLAAKTGGNGSIARVFVGKIVLAVFVVCWPWNPPLAAIATRADRTSVLEGSRITCNDSYVQTARGAPAEGQVEQLRAC